MKFKTIKTILFDLGDVILPLDKQRMYKAFEKLGGHCVSQKFESPEGQELYKQYEHELPTTEFRKNLRALLQLPNTITNSEIDFAWNQLLLPIPQARLEQIHNLKKNYNIVLLSNSNDIHFEIIQTQYGEKFRQIFTQQYYSHLIKKSKPNADSFLHALNGQDPETVIFFDDKQANIDAAKKIGLHAVQFTVQRDINEILDEIKQANITLQEKAKQRQIGDYAKFGLFSIVATLGVGILSATLRKNLLSSNKK